MSDPACDPAHGGGPAPTEPAPLLVAVFASPVAADLLAFARRLGWRTALVEPDPARAGGPGGDADEVTTDAARLRLDDGDVVVTDHDRDEIGAVLRAGRTGGFLDPRGRGQRSTDSPGARGA